ncbi:hypothetical protein BJ878DRAFT_509987 [Calycina marina]|uniref:Uncharacterized protein n=1 Tax=Calycina marina TaxID=1763456 RepID=A0A9P7Z2C3_9HELO|nr:hypothetical protein BJ878DRAFT_509987 [Calycina marina]
MSSWSLTSPSNETTTALIDPPPAIKNIGKRRGELAVEPVEGLDRSPAVVGRREVSKLSVSYKTKKYDDQQRLIDGAGAIYRYPHEMDWNNRDHVKKLNAWREQIHRRTFDQKRKTRPYWIEAEKAAVIELLGQHLQERAAVSKFDPLYKRVANVYNTRYHGRLQFAGHRLVADSRARAGGLLDKDRPAPWRTASALLGVSKKWPELTSMLGRASGEVRQHNEDIGFPVRGSSEGGSDDEEIPNPDNSLPSTTFSSSKKSAKHVGKVAGIPINLGRGNHRGGVVCDWAAAEGRLADGCDHDGDFFKDDTEWERANKRLEMEAGYESSDEEAIIVPGSSSRVSNSYVSAFIT